MSRREVRLSDSDLAALKVNWLLDPIRDQGGSKLLSSHSIFRLDPFGDHETI